MKFLQTLFQREPDRLSRVSHDLQILEENLRLRQPIYALGDKIGEISLDCSKALLLLYKDGEEGAWESMFVIRAFIFFFSHLASRMTLLEHGEAIQKELMILLDDGNRKCFVYSFIKCPEESEQKLYDDFSAAFRKHDEVYWQSQSLEDACHCLEGIICGHFSLGESERRVREIINRLVANAVGKIPFKHLVDTAVAALPRIRCSLTLQ